MPQFVAAITAGGRIDGALALRAGTTVKALVPVGARLLIDAAIAAARGAGATRIAVVGPEAVRAHCTANVDEVIDESPSGEENLRKALGTARGAALLLLTSDLPFVAAEDVDTFVRRASSDDVAMPLASEHDYVAAYPGAPPHVVTLCGERVANGNVFFFAPVAVARVDGVAERLFSARKSPLRMASLLGPALLAKFVFRRLRIADIEARGEKLFGLRLRALRDAAPGLCYDIDTAEDYAYALARIAANA
jgi:GTP:adenosylcobinamide-phosphate guanylyltransferase